MKTKPQRSVTDDFYDAPSPARAITLAISDHEAFNKGHGIVEYTHQLRVARDMVADHAIMLKTLREIVAINKSHAGRHQYAAMAAEAINELQVTK